MCDVYNIEITENNVKEIISRLFVNISNSEMSCLEDFVDNYIFIFK